MAVDTTKITGAADDLSDKLTKGGSAAKTLGAEIANAFKALDDRVTALEAGGGTQPPIEPPIEPPSNNAGLITNFSGGNGSRLNIGGIACSAQNGNKSWSLKNPDPYTLRFEVHSGDQWSTSNYTDPSTCERSEVQMEPLYNAGVALKSEFGLTVEAGPRTTSAWMVIAQYHQTVSGGSVPFAVEIMGDKLSIMTRDNPKVERRAWTDSNYIQRGHKYVFRVETKFASNGYCKVWIDGTQVVNFTGSIGYGSGEQYYWKNGIYRYESPEALATNVSNLDVRPV